MTNTTKSQTRIEIVEQAENMCLGDHVDFVTRDGAGGIATFSGNVRDTNEGRDVDYLEYDCYEEMTRKKLRTVLRRAREKWSDRGALNIAVSHRIGAVQVGETAVIVAVSAPHRAEALEACRYIIDELKAEAPIWKKEHFSDGETWVENPTSKHGEPS